MALRLIRCKADGFLPKKVFFNDGLFFVYLTLCVGKRDKNTIHHDDHPSDGRGSHVGSGIKSVVLARQSYRA